MPSSSPENELACLRTHTHIRTQYRALFRFALLVSRSYSLHIELLEPLADVLGSAPERARVRQLFILTDGEVTNPAACIEIVRVHSGEFCIVWR